MKIEVGRIHVKGGRRGLDVDYVAVPVPVGAGSVADNYARFIQDAPDPGFHIVALGEFGLDELPGILEAGCAGVAVSAAIADSDNPVEATSAMIEVLEKARYGG